MRIKLKGKINKVSRIEKEPNAEEEVTKEK
jgi:hypothetical protein